MKNGLFFLFLVVLFFTENLSAQIGTYIPADRRADWRNVGIPGGIPNKASVVLNILTDYVDKYNLTNADDALAMARTDAKSYTGLVAIYFPSGTYTFHNTITFNPSESNIVIKGDGAGEGHTVFNFQNITGDLFDFSGTASTNTVGISSYNASTKTITLSQPDDEIGTNDYVEIVMENSPKYPQHYDSGWDPQDYVGQIVKVTGKSASTSFQLEDDISLTWNYNQPDAPINPRIRKFTPVKKIGIEAISIVAPYPNQYNFNFVYAVNCWLKGVQSWRPGKRHVVIEKSTGLEIRGCCFDEAQSYGENGEGYGICMQLHPTNCLIEDNCFKQLRHAMLVQCGANRNVFGYNYARDRMMYNGILDISNQAADICLHGGYPYANLFEGNCVDYINVDDVHGLNGPYNTFFRNKMIADDNYPSILNLTYGGIRIENGQQNSYGNVFFDILDQHYNAGTFNDKNGNYKLDLFSGDAVYEDISYYYESKPQFLNNYTWPAVGTHKEITSPSQDIPAKSYFDSNNDHYTNYLSKRVVPTNKITVTQYSDEIQHNFGFYKVFENQNYINIESGGDYITSGNPVVKYSQDFRTRTTDKFYLNYDNSGQQNRFINYFNSENGHQYKGYFQKAENATLNVICEGTTNPNGAVVQFIDPWLYDLNNPTYGQYNHGLAAIPYNVTLTNNNLGTGTQYKGVLKNQSYNPNDPQKCYYSVKGTLTQTINGKTYIFQGWSGTNANFVQVGDNPSGYDQKAVVFTNSNAVVTASYKGSMVSNNQNAFINNNQRKVVRTAEGYLHVVYESMNKVWYELSTDNGATWTIMNDGKPLYNGNNAKYPSIDCFGNDVVIAYQVGDGINIRVERYKNYATSYYRQNDLLVEDYECEAAKNPVVCIGYKDNSAKFIIVAWEEANGLYYRYGSIDASQMSWLPNSPEKVKITDTDANSKNPAIAGGKYTSDPSRVYHLTWLQSGSISKINYKTFTESSNILTEGTTVLVHSLAGNKNPSITCMDNSNANIAIVWENESNGKVYFKEKYNSNWSTKIFTNSTYMLKQPTVCYDHVSNKTILVFQCDTHLGRCEKDITNSDNTAWTQMMDIGTGSTPSLPALVATGSNAQPLVASITGSGLYNINANAISRIQSPMTITTNTTFNGVYIISSNITVNSGAALTITPGSILSFANGASLVVNGVLNAVGSPDNKITFTSQSGTTNSSWSSITLSGAGASGSKIQNANIQYGTRVEAINAANIEVSDCYLLNCYDGIRFSGSTGSILRNVIESNSTGHGIIVENTSTVTCNQNKLTKTAAIKSGVGVLYRSAGSGSIWQNDLSGWDLGYRLNL